MATIHSILLSDGTTATRKSEGRQYVAAVVITRTQVSYDAILARTRKALPRCRILLIDPFYISIENTPNLWRKKVLDLLEGTWLNRLEPDGRVLSIGTAWHQGDANHVLMQRAGWCTLIHRVSADCTRIEQEVLGARDGQYPMPISP